MATSNDFARIRTPFLSGETLSCDFLAHYFTIAMAIILCLLLLRLIYAKTYQAFKFELFEKNDNSAISFSDWYMSTKIKFSTKEFAFISRKAHTTRGARSKWIANLLLCFFYLTIFTLLFSRHLTAFFHSLTIAD